MYKRGACGGRVTLLHAPRRAGRAGQPAGAAAAVAAARAPGTSKQKGRVIIQKRLLRICGRQRAAAQGGVLRVCAAAPDPRVIGISASAPVPDIGQARSAAPGARRPAHRGPCGCFAAPQQPSAPTRWMGQAAAVSSKTHTASAVNNRLTHMAELTGGAASYACRLWRGQIRCLATS